MVDLSIGTPVDDTPELLATALAGAGNAPGYPTALGAPELRTAAAGWLQRRLGVRLADPENADHSHEVLDPRWAGLEQIKTMFDDTKES